MSRESTLSKQVMKDLKDLPNTWFERITQTAIRGTPDILGCADGRFVALETKRRGGKVDPIQAHKLHCIGEAGGFVTVVTPENWGQVFEQLKQLLKKGLTK